MKNPKMHISLYVADIQNTVTFYSHFFNQEPAKVKSGYAKFELDEPALVISFAENAERISSDFGHLGFRVETETELQAEMNRLQKLGISIKEEMGTQCCYALQDKFWVSDPDGYAWEVYQLHQDVEFNDPHYAQTGASTGEACCSPAMKVEEKSNIQIKEMSAGPVCTPESGCC